MSKLTILVVGKPHNKRKEECMKIASKLAMPMMAKKKKKGPMEDAEMEAAMDENEDSEMEDMYAAEEEGDEMEMEDEEASPLADLSDEELLAEIKKRKLKV